MPEPVFYMRGFRVPGMVPIISQPMVDDLLVVANLEKDQVSRLASSLRQADGFLGPERLRGTIKEVLAGEEQVDPIFRVLQNITEADLPELLQGLAEWRQAEDNRTRLPEVEFQRLKECLPRLLQSYPALERYRKARRLEEITGQSLEEMELICDLRPIFDSERRQVEGLIPYTTLKVVVTGADGLPVSLEAELSASQVSGLAEKAKKAQQKLKVLRELAEQWVPGGVPKVQRTDPENRGDASE